MKLRVDELVPHEKSGPCS